MARCQSNLFPPHRRTRQQKVYPREPTLVMSTILHWCWHTLALTLARRPRGTSEEHQQRGGGGGHLPGFFGRAQKEVGTTGLSGEGTLTRRGDEVTPCPARTCVCVCARVQTPTVLVNTRAQAGASVPGEDTQRSRDKVRMKVTRMAAGGQGHEWMQGAVLPLGGV